VLALICTESPRRAVEYDGIRYWVAIGPRALPQGACTSPALTRYADDLTFSAAAGKREEVGRLLARVRHLAGDEGFTVHPRKGRILRSGGRQSVTGIVVNDKGCAERSPISRWSTASAASRC
jgi:hypothetical protein